MFCPKCGAALIDRHTTLGETYHCVPGDLTFSMVVARALRHRYAEASGASVPQLRKLPYQSHSHDALEWYCPGCGVRLNPDLACDRCGRHLRDLAYDLIELHPHRRRVDT
jgi:hypothetical protein